ncbi:MAG: hypothetical protein CVU97_01110 [Firmicutes bacterium HGW-Firmicutes-21]|nr:MAG: hypothetical protein CVU97_01110 [Firmicutes bacterium HGW-Firmicutes-21]
MQEMTENLIAPCGMNCKLCYAYQREKNKCKGCRSNNEFVPNSCIRCIIRNCPVIKNNVSGFCYECEKYPCRRLKDLDKRYRTKYHMSMLENLEIIKNHGINSLLNQEEKRWICLKCGNVICVHKNACQVCKSTYIE